MSIDRLIEDIRRQDRQDRRERRMKLIDYLVMCKDRGDQPRLTDEEFDRIIDALRDALEKDEGE